MHKTNRIKKAIIFADMMHEDHVRKYTGMPYITHPIAVAEIVAKVTKDESMIMAAILHDTVEDTNATLREIEDMFGERVAMLVEGLTDISKPEDGNRKTRKRLDREHIINSHPDVKTIKLADLIHNSISITNYDEAFAKVYMEEIKLLLEGMHEGDATLYAKASSIVKKYYAEN